MFGDGAAMTGIPFGSKAFFLHYNQIPLPGTKICYWRQPHFITSQNMQGVSSRCQLLPCSLSSCTLIPGTFASGSRSLPTGRCEIPSTKHLILHPSFTYAHSLGYEHHLERHLKEIVGSTKDCRKTEPGHVQITQQRAVRESKDNCKEKL